MLNTGSNDPWEADNLSIQNSNNIPPSSNSCWSFLKRCVSIVSKAVAIYKFILAILFTFVAPVVLSLSLIIFGLIRLFSDSAYIWLSAISIIYGIVLIIAMANSFYLFLFLIGYNLKHSTILNDSKWQKYRTALKDKIWIAYLQHILVAIIFVLSLGGFIASIDYLTENDIPVISFKYFTNSKIGFGESLFFSACYFLVIPFFWVKWNTLALNNFQEPEPVPPQISTIILWFVVFGCLPIGFSVTILYFIISNFDECPALLWLKYYSIFLILLIFASFIQWSYLLYILKRNFFLAPEPLWGDVESKQKIAHGLIHVFLFIIVIILSISGSVLALALNVNCREMLGFLVSLSCSGVIIAILWICAFLREGLTQSQREILGIVLGIFKKCVECGHCVESHV